jgi:hypothetical protein
MMSRPRDVVASLRLLLRRCGMLLRRRPRQSPPQCHRLARPEGGVLELEPDGGAGGGPMSWLVDRVRGAGADVGLIGRRELLRLRLHADARPRRTSAVGWRRAGASAAGAMGGNEELGSKSQHAAARPATRGES